MTPKEAIEQLRWIEEGELHRYFNEDDFDAFDLAVEALEKQVPENALPEKRYYDFGKCPRCGVIFTDDSTKYCGNCGQAIDWEEGEAE